MNGMFHNSVFHTKRLFCGLLFILISSFAQTSQAQSFEGSEISSLGDEEKSRKLLNRANRFGLFSDSSRYYLLELDAFARKAELPMYQIEANYLLGKYYLLKLHITPAKQHFKFASNLAERYKAYEQQGFALDRLGIAFNKEKKPDSALLCFQRSSEIYRTHALEHRLWTPYQGISQVYQGNGEYEQAKHYGELGLKSLEGFDEPVARTILLNHLLTISRDAEELEDYAHYLNLYLKEFDPESMGTGGMHLVAYYYTIEDPNELIAEIEYAIEQLSRHEPTLSLLSSYYHLGIARDNVGYTTGAIDAWRTGLEIDLSLEGMGFILAYTQKLVEAYRSLGDYQQALYYMEQNTEYANELLESENAKKIAELQLKYETAQKENTIQSQRYDLESQRKQRNYILIVSASLLILAFMFIYTLRARINGQRVIAEQQSELQKQEIQDLQQKNEVLALQAMIRGQEEERKRIAQDLHDGLGGLLSTVKLNFQGLGDRENPEISKTGDLIDEACSEVRRISHNMMPHALMRMGLASALQDLIAQLQGGSDIDFSFQNLNYNNTLEKDQEIMIYRIAQELVTNATKHSKAKSVIMQISQYNGTFSLVVEDDGSGFEPDKLGLQVGLGLQSVKSRVHLLRGKSSTESIIGEGTTITIDIPVIQVANLN